MKEQKTKLASSERAFIVFAEEMLGEELGEHKVENLLKHYRGEVPEGVVYVGTRFYNMVKRDYVEQTNFVNKSRRRE